jgi:exoribonuclease R
MRVTQSGVYVMVQKFGIEGLLTCNKPANITINAEKEEALIEGSGPTRTVKVFENVMVDIKAEMAEFRRTVTLCLAPV